MRIKVNSKAVKPGDTFIAVKGFTVDGHDYVKDAIARGAKKVVVERGNYEVETIHVDDTKQYLISYLDHHYGAKIKSLKLIGITGTNGKTTSCYLLYQALNKLQKPTAYIGTIGFYLKDKIKVLDQTTPDIIAIYEMLLECLRAKIEYVVMEVSSHGLKQDRLGKIKFDYAVFTNLTPEHLDYHINLTDYALSKQKLMQKLNKKGKAIVNIDADFQELMLIHQHNLTYGYNPSDYQILDYKIKGMTTSFRFQTKKESYEVVTPIPGQYNIYNILTMIIILDQEKFDKVAIMDIVPFLKAPPGRMDIINYKDNSIIIDYAHTPDAVSNVLKTIKEYAQGQIYCLIGCGGERDKVKREPMGYYATTLADQVIFTSDNPRSEDPKAIINDLVKGAASNNYQIIIDRKEAIKAGLNQLTKNDIFLILGKGHEGYQIIGKEKREHNDKEYVLKLIN